MRQPRASKNLYPLDAGAGGKAAAKANQACHSCKRQKRKCDKSLPSCSLCTRMSRTCDYSDIPPAPTAEDIMTLQLKLFELESRLNGSGGIDGNLDVLDSRSESLSHSSHTPRSVPREALWEGNSNNSFPSTVFLDQGLYRRAGGYIPRPLFNVPSDIYQCIGDRDSLQQAIADYFSDIHPWLPMVTKTRMNFDNEPWDGGADLPLLYLSMKLITSQPRVGFEAVENYLYTASKRFLSLLESSGTASLLYLQALVLVALYEYGQGIYPAAWMTVGQCVRYADFIGLPSYGESNDVLGQCATWTEIEERRRTWWAVYILDKMVSIGSGKRALYNEPPPSETLPVEDSAWELGDISGAIQGTVSSPFTNPQSSFGRLCQSALVASRALCCLQRVNTCRMSGQHFDRREVTSLTESAHILSASINTEMTTNPAAYFNLLPAQCLTQSVVMKMLNIYIPESSCGSMRILTTIESSLWDEEDLSLQITSLEDRRKTSEHVRNLARDLFSFIRLDEEMVKTSPFIMDAIYSASTALLASWRECTGTGAGDPNAEAGLATVKKLLVRLGGRWRLGVEYLRALEQHEMNPMMGQNFAGSQAMPMVSLPTSIVSMPTIVC